ncbi:L-asparaginase II [Anaerosolibacter carboniphilus]|uniref:L-asparaginase II n=1 Tax=Anaerosolibacter carboniphilus TaxID=1417629 RepID=A0A841L5F5_9FIRM|nr:asparaginase [Anaerosolibacter carboniphilus]MBB6217649.1 L-asparaginase II [Anaerosolibacter carboniphilus]
MNSLVILTRSNRIESVHRGKICISDASGRVLSHIGDPQGKIYMRSSAKPFQAVALVASGAMEKYGLTMEELAIICSSHSGEDIHRSTVDSILRKIGLTEDALECGACNPYNKEMNALLIQKKEKPTPLYNCCSGKHAGMLALCRYHHYPIENYTDSAHPVQQLILKVVAELLAINTDQIPLGIDGCGVPNFMLSMKQGATLYARLAAGTNIQHPYALALEQIKTAMLSYPVMISGDGEFCTELMLHTHGKVIGKVGGEGIYSIAVPEMNWGMMIKVDDGNERAVYPVSLHLLRQLGILNGSLPEGLQPWAYPPVKDHKGKIVGYTLPAFDLHGRQLPEIEIGKEFSYGGEYIWNHWQ